MPTKLKAEMAEQLDTIAEICADGDLTQAQALSAIADELELDDDDSDDDDD